jgi:hypothetical protein
MSEIVVNRYSDEDLEEFKVLIEKKNRRGKKEPGSLSGSILWCR